MKLLNMLIIFGLISIWGCSSVTYRTDFDPEIDFSKYKTYMWYGGEMPADDALSKVPLVKKRVALGIEKALLNKEMRQGTQESYDFIIIMHAGSKERMQATSYGYGGYGYGRYGGGWGGTTSVSYYDETTLVIDIVDFEKQELAWRGTAAGTVKKYNDAEERQARIDDVVANILEEFPPVSK